MQLLARMRYYPAYDEFVELARGKNLVPIFRQLAGDTLTPVSAFCKIQEGDWAFLFESVVGGERPQAVAAILERVLGKERNHVK